MKEPIWWKGSKAEFEHEGSLIDEWQIRVYVCEYNEKYILKGVTNI